MCRRLRDVWLGRSFRACPVAARTSDRTILHASVVCEYSLSRLEGSFCALDLYVGALAQRRPVFVRKGRQLIRLYSLIAMASFLISGVAWPADERAATRQPIRIAPQPLAPALQILAREREFQVVYRSELVGNRRTRGVDGNLTFEEALTQLLSGSGLTYLYLADRAITLVPLPPGG